MSIHREDVLRIASLAKLELSEAAVDRYADQLARILDYIEILRTVPETVEDAGDPSQPTATPDAGLRSADGVTAALGAASTDPTSSPASSTGARASVLRPDSVTRPADPELGLAAAPDREGDLFRVPRILE